MPEVLENRLDQALNFWRDRRLRDRATREREKQLLLAQEAERRHEIEKFAGNVGPMLQNSLLRANGHIAKKRETCALRDISGHYSGSLQPGGSVCNPIAFEFCAGGTPVGYPLIVELTPSNYVSASITGYPGARLPGVGGQGETGLNWDPVPLDRFDQGAADDIVACYVAAVITLACPDSEDRAEGQQPGSTVSA